MIEMKKRVGAACSTERTVGTPQTSASHFTLRKQAKIMKANREAKFASNEKRPPSG